MACQEWLSYLTFQFGYLCAEARLRARDADRGALKAQLFSQHDEVPKLLQIHEAASIVRSWVWGVYITIQYRIDNPSAFSELPKHFCSVGLVMTQESKPQGRPRSETVDRLILEAAQRQLANVGFAQMTIESVVEAGVTRPTLYRRWKSKEDLATAAIAALQISSPPPTKDDVWSAVEAELVHFRRSLERPNGMSMIGMVLLEEHRVPELAALFRSRLIEPRRQRMTALLRNGIERGEISAGADVGTAVASAIGSFYAHHIATGAVPKNWERKTILFLRQALG
jgi:AcrR family transcriptional regulator